MERREAGKTGDARGTREVGGGQWRQGGAKEKGGGGKGGKKEGTTGKAREVEEARNALEAKV